MGSVKAGTCVFYDHCAKKYVKGNQSSEVCRGMKQPLCPQVQPCLSNVSSMLMERTGGYWVTRYIKPFKTMRLSYLKEHKSQS